MTRTHAHHIVFTLGLVGIFGFFFGSAFFQLEAQDISADIQNDAPQIVGGTVKICDNSTPVTNTDGAISACSNLSSISLSAGGTVDVSMFARARDNNGYGDIPTGPFSGVFYHSGNADTGDETCSEDENNCYHLSCSKVVNILGGSNTDAWIRCDFALEYFTDHSVGTDEWIGYVEIYDSAANTADSGSAYTTEIEKLVSATFPVVNFGTRSAGVVTNGSNNVSIQHQNQGNVLIDLSVAVDNDDANQSLDCDTLGSIPDGNISFDIVDSSYASSSYTLVSEPSSIELNIDIQQRTNDATPVLNDDTGDIQRTYWNVSVPATGVEGFCEEELIVTVFEGP